MVIPNYNGRRLLELFLPGMVEFALKNGIELLVIDDASTDESVRYLQSEFPSLKLLVNQQNLGFGKSCNRAVAVADGEYIFLLNTDIKFLDIDMSVIEKHMQLPDFFALTFKSFYPETMQFREGAKRLKIKSGLPFVLHNEKDQLPPVNGLQTSFYPVGGHSLINRQRFLDLGGFSDLYSPFYWEDSDLGYRAMKRGWQTYFDPRLTVIHDHQTSSIKTNFAQKRIRQIKLRNRIIFMYHNFTFKERLTAFYPGMILRSLTALISFNTDLFKAWLAALNEVRTHKNRL